MFRRFLNIYTDGASRKDKRGGWGIAVFEHGKPIHEACGGAYDTTIGRMELMGAIKALEWVKAEQARTSMKFEVTMYLDAKYVLDGINDYLDIWIMAGWRTTGNNPLKNRDLWEILGHLDCDIGVKAWKHVKGHSGVYGNELADVLSGEGVPHAIPTTPATPVSNDSVRHAAPRRRNPVRG